MLTELTPSRRAASMMSPGMPLIAAERMVMANPAWIQIMITISSSVFNGEPMIQFTGLPPSHTRIWFSRPICFTFAWSGR